MVWSPLLTRTSYSAETGLNLLDSDLQTNNFSTKSSSRSSSHNSSDTTFAQLNVRTELPDAIQKEMNKKRIGETISDVAGTIKSRKNIDKKPYNSHQSERHSTAGSETTTKNFDILYHIFGSPVYNISRRASIENDSFFTDLASIKPNNRLSLNRSPVLLKRKTQLANNRDKSPSFEVKKFPNPFGSPIFPIM